MKTNSKEQKRLARHLRVRKKVKGNEDRLRIVVHRSANNLFVQAVDDAAGKALFGLTTLNKDIAAQVKYGGNKKAAEALGKAFAEKAKAQGISRFCFDRGGYKYHGRVRAFADAAREGGLEF